MSWIRKAALILAAIPAFVQPCRAAAPDTARAVERPVLSAYTIGIGSAHTAETYLSPLRYSGWCVAPAYERLQAMRFSPDRWVMQLRGRLNLAKTHNPAGNASMWNLGLDLRWGMMHRWALPQGFSIYAGGHTAADVGVFYAPRNSNNPAAAKASWTVGISAMAAWNGRLGRLPVCLRYQADLPLTGIFFSPQYGELYYEIYLGNHKGLVRGAWPGNFFRLDNLLTADLRFGRTTVRLGYSCGISSTSASHIVTRHITHTAVVGFTNEWLSLGTRRPAPDPRIIRALY